jgi:anti-sigma B factor antagonist
MSNSRSPKVHRAGRVTVVTLGTDYENLDETAVRDVREVVLDTVDTARPSAVVLDLSATTFFGSSFLEVLFRAHSRTQDRSGRFAVSGLNDYCAEVIEVTHLDRLIEIFPDLETAVAAFEAALPDDASPEDSNG